MSQEGTPLSRLAVFTGILGAGALLWTIGQGPAAVAAAAQAQAQSNFMGGNPSRVPSDKISTSRLKFPKGSRSNWHTHSWGQLLMAEEGRGLTQERGGPVREVLPHQPWFTKAGIEHWHGAAPDVDMLQLTIYEGDVKWLEPVTDDQYRVTAKK
jgi:quercetin dioxygenase-like cupin family protein